MRILILLKSEDEAVALTNRRSLSRNANYNLFVILHVRYRDPLGCFFHADSEEIQIIVPAQRDNMELPSSVIIESTARCNTAPPTVAQMY